MALTSMKLFFAGKLFQNPLRVFGLSVVGVAIALVIAGALLYLGLAPALAAAISGFVAGVAQPYLFRNLKYR
ncbi:MAG: hypothetical protein KDD11_13110 [Acidobacteria bacterium]|nr:hypothetical protein [Acidobacteriota bacterium]